MPAKKPAKKLAPSTRVLRLNNERMRAALLNIQSLAESGFPINSAKLAARCRHARETQPAKHRKRLPHAT
jgi:hypothetical protein